MKQIPNEWLGTWIDDTGKIVLLEHSSNKISVSVKNAGGEFYAINLIGDDVGNSKELPAQFAKDNKGYNFLQVEAGHPGLGPTYNLYFVTEGKDGRFIIAQPNDPIEKIIIKPDIGMGLYDDWEDDLGVPWALPLLDLIKETSPHK